MEDNDHGEEGDRWKWLKDIDLDSASFPEQSEGTWSIRVFKDVGYTVVSRVDFDILPKRRDGGRTDVSIIAGSRGFRGCRTIALEIEGGGNYGIANSTASYSGI